MNSFFTALKHKRARREFIKSNIVGIIAVGADFLTQAIVLYLAASDMYPSFFSVFTGQTLDGYTERLSIYLASIIISFIVSGSINYLLSAFFVYQYGNVGRNKNGVIKFMTFSSIGLALTISLSALFREIFKLPVFIVKVVVSLSVFIYNFFTRKYYIFNIELIMDEDNTIAL